MNLPTTVSAIFNFTLQYYSTTAQNLQAYKLEIQFNFLAGCGTNKFRIQEKFRIRPDPDLQYCKKSAVCTGYLYRYVLLSE